MCSNLICIIKWWNSDWHEVLDSNSAGYKAHSTAPGNLFFNVDAQWLTEDKDWLATGECGANTNGSHVYNFRAGFKQAQGATPQTPSL